ncbi:MAG: sodium/proline symporter [Gammaproteobacteria bacterium]|nr:sodium/proline symporter [Gammaproteobacteria bacterium]
MIKCLLWSAQMSKHLTILLTLIAYKITLIVIGLWAQRRTRDNTDFFLGGRRLGPVVAAISASASSSSAWTLLGVSGAAYVWGLSAIWLFPATVGGFLLNWLWVAPRLMPASRASRAITLPEFIAGDSVARTWILRLASVIILFSFMFYVAAQFQAAGDAFASTFDVSMHTAILIGAGIVVLYTLLGGFWAVSVSDTLQGLLMALTAVLLPVAALIAVGGFAELMTGLGRTGDLVSLSTTGKFTGIAAVGFVLGTLGIGMGYPGQPHVVNRFMALRDERALSQARVIAIIWAIVVYAGMLLLGLCGRVLVNELDAGEQVFFVLSDRLFPPVVAGVMIAAVLSAIMSTADSQLLTAASSVSHDWRLAADDAGSSLGRTRIVVMILSAAAVAVALFAPETIFKRVLFAWHAIGSAFGPLVLLRLAGYRIVSGALLASMLTGFLLTIALYWVPDTPGDVAERLLPFVLALLIARLGATRTS